MWLNLSNHFCFRDSPASSSFKAGNFFIVLNEFILVAKYLDNMKQSFFSTPLTSQVLPGKDLFMYIKKSLCRAQAQAPVSPCRDGLSSIWKINDVQLIWDTKVFSPQFSVSVWEASWEVLGWSSPIAVGSCKLPWGFLTYCSITAENDKALGGSWATEL